MRLDKFLAQASIGKRKDVRIYIKNGLVKVNGQAITKPAVEINEKIDCIEYLNETVEYNEKLYYIFHKPAGCITAKSDINNKTIFHYLEDIKMKGLFHVGRLDKDTEGLLLLTNDGEFEHRLMHPKHHIEKTYFFWALGDLNEEDIKRLENGICIGKSEALTKPAKIKVEKYGLYKELNNHIPTQHLQYINPNQHNQRVVSGYLTISEGRKHQVKRMLKAVGCYVVYLKRISIGGLSLDRSLEKGQYRVVSNVEFEKIFLGT